MPICALRVLGLGLQQVVVGGDRLVVVLQVAIRRADLQVDDAERRRAAQNRAVDPDGLVELLLLEERVRGRRAAVGDLLRSGLRRRPAAGRSLSAARTRAAAAAFRSATMFNSVNCGWNPGASAVNIHSPRARPMIANRPLSSVAAVSDPSGASGFSARIVAPLIGWPLSSLTNPATRATCAAADAAQPRTKAVANNGTEGISPSIHGRFASKHAKLSRKAFSICAFSIA